MAHFQLVKKAVNSNSKRDCVYHVEQILPFFPCSLISACFSLSGKNKNLLLAKLVPVDEPPIRRIEDLEVLRRSPDLLNNCKTGQGKLQLIMKHILFIHIWGLQPFWSSNINNLTAQ